MKRQNNKIIVFDDDEEILLICSYILEEDGWEVHSFNDCNNVIERVKAIMPAAIFMDNMIPGSGGVVATQLLKNYPLTEEIPVIYFSANTDIQQLARLAKADKYLAKPFDLEDILLVLSAL